MVNYIIIQLVMLYENMKYNEVVSAGLQFQPICFNHYNAVAVISMQLEILSLGHQID